MRGHGPPDMARRARCGRRERRCHVSGATRQDRKSRARPGPWSAAGGPPALPRFAAMPSAGSRRPQRRPQSGIRQGGGAVRSSQDSLAPGLAVGSCVPLLASAPLIPPHPPVVVSCLSTGEFTTYISIGCTHGLP